MQFLKSLFFLCFVAFSAVGLAADFTDSACEKLLVQAETDPNPDVYTKCGFDDSFRAWEVWAPFAAAHDMKRALYELCVRYPEHKYGLLYCQKAVDLNYGPALIHFGDMSFTNGNDEDALDYYIRASQTTDLTAEEKNEILEKTGMIYLKETSPLFNPRSAVALLARAAANRSAVSNNMLGYLVFSGKYGLQKNPQKALEYLWTAILLGCPSAEENLGAFHLARQEKIPFDEAVYYMSLQATSCQPFDKEKSLQTGPITDCDCADILEKETFYQKQDYFYLDMPRENHAVLKDKKGVKKVYGIREELPNGAVIQEIKAGLVTLQQNGKNVFINRYHEGSCVTRCLARANMQKTIREPIKIRPYRLTFTKQECADIDYYAQKLMDTSLPYVGKEECSVGTVDDKAKILLGL